MSASSRSTCMQRHSSSAALCAVSRWRLWARDEGAVSGTPHQSSRERFAFQPHRRHDDCGTAVSMSLTLSKSGPPTMSSNCVACVPLLSLNPFKPGVPNLKVCRNAQMFTLNALWNFKNVSYCSLNIINNNKSKALVFVFIYLLFTLFGLMIATFHLNTFIALLYEIA